MGVIDLFFNNISSGKLPKEIKSKNLLSVIIEVRFKRGLSIEQNIFNLYPEIKESFEHPVRTNFNVPQEIKIMDDTFKYLPDWTLNDTSKCYTLGIGAYAISFTSLNFRYKGWDDFFDLWKRLWMKCNGIFSLFSNEVEQIGVRFINAFNIQEDFYSNLNFSAKICDTDVLDFEYTSQFAFSDDANYIKLSLSNNASYGYYDYVTEEQKKQNNAAIIDIDVITNKDLDKVDIIETVANNHKKAKQIFFSLWRKDKIKDILGVNLE